jgi:hypothetical protein
VFQITKHYGIWRKCGKHLLDQRGTLIDFSYSSGQQGSFSLSAHWWLDMNPTPERGSSSENGKPAPGSQFCPQIAPSFPFFPGHSCASHAFGPVICKKTSAVSGLCRCCCKLCFILVGSAAQNFFGLGEHPAASPHILCVFMGE